MDKLVYLFELDSVRNSRIEMELGQRAIFDEVVNNGNQIALTFNQITDSAAFLSVLLDDEMYPHILLLAKKGVFRFSRYGNVRTPAQYVCNSLEKNINEMNVEKEKNTESKEKDSVFLFSAVPITCRNEQEIIMLKEAIMYSDLTKYDVELENAEGVEYKRILFLKRFVELILTLSEQTVTINEKKEETPVSLLGYIEEFIGLYGNEVKEFPETEILPRTLLSEALGVMASVKEMNGVESKKKNERSWWIECLRTWNEENETTVSEEAILLAEAILDLCYNYTVEDSIRDVSKHYKNHSVKQEGDASLENDFEQRLLQYWKQGKTLAKYTDGQGKEQQGYIHTFQKVDTNMLPDYEGIEIPDWSLAVRLVNNMFKDKEKKQYVGSPYAGDEIELYREQKVWRRNIALRVFQNIGLAIAFIIIYCVVDIGVDKLQDILADFFVISSEGQELSKVVVIAQELSMMCIKIIFFGIVASMISTLLKIPDVLESILGIGRNLIDIFRIRRLRNNSSYASYDGVIEMEK